MERLTISILITLAVFLFSTTEGWSLPAYPGSYNKNTWTNCLGTYTSAKGRVLEGIWEDGRFKYARKGPPPVTVKRSPPPQARERQAELRRQIEQRRQAEARKNSEYVGTIKKRQEMALTIEHIFKGEGAAFSYHDNGIYYIVSFTDSAKNSLSWFTKNIPAKWEKGQTITVKATVKAHEVYRGTKQTKINRVKEV